jgi:hypothetical protein
MPWEIKEANGQFCVHKKGEEKPLKCYRVKGKAEAYMRALYAHEPNASISFEQTDGPIEFDLQAGEEGDILVFRNAILARAEVNANRDEITDTGIQELAATIAGRPIDDEHNIETLVGSFTAGRVVDGKALQVDGFIWADRWPEVAELVRAGKKGLSIEATAKQAKCSVCGETFEGSHDYCEHIFSKRSKVKHNAVRTLSGLKAKGGATTLVPAATDAKFTDIYMVASHSDFCPYCESTILGSVETCPECGIDIEAEITKREDVNPKEGENKYGDVKFADEKNKKYPIDTEAHIRAAWNYINKAKNAAKYSSEEVAAIKRKIVAAWKSKIDKEGPPSANKEESKMEPEVQATVSPEEEEKKKKAAEEAALKEKEEKEKNEQEASVLKAEVEKLTAALEDYKKKVAEAEAALAKANEEKASLEARYAAKVLGSVLDGDELNTALEKAKGMTPDQIDLVASVSAAPKPKTKTGLRFLDSSGGTDGAPTKDKLTL